jgi:hypothetical protein
MSSSVNVVCSFSLISLSFFFSSSLGVVIGREPPTFLQSTADQSGFADKQGSLDMV